MLVKLENQVGLVVTSDRPFRFVAIIAFTLPSQEVLVPFLFAA